MTAIAYRDGVMAADSLDQTTMGVKNGYVRKIAKRDDGALIGCAGAAGDCERLIDAFLENRIDDEEPTRDKDNGYAALIIEPDGSIWRLTEIARKFRQPSAPFHTEGCAYAILVGAMAAGSTAEEAVRIAIEWDTRCGGDVHVERLGPDIGVLPRSSLKVSMPPGAAVPR